MPARQEHLICGRMTGNRRFRNYPDFGEDRWGGAVDFKLGNHVFVQFGVSQGRMNY